MLSRLTEGTYVFILKVTDSSGQSNEATVKVIVLPEQNSAPVAVAGDDKVIILIILFKKVGLFRTTYDRIRLSYAILGLQMVI